MPVTAYSSAKIIEDYNHPLFNTAHRLDIYVPDKGLAFEYDERTWHYAEKDLIEIDQDELDHTTGNTEVYRNRFAQCPYCFNPSVISKLLLAVKDD